MQGENRYSLRPAPNSAIRAALSCTIRRWGLDREFQRQPAEQVAQFDQAAVEFLPGQRPGAGIDQLQHIGDDGVALLGPLAKNPSARARAVPGSRRT